MPLEQPLAFVALLRLARAWRPSFPHQAVNRSFAQPNASDLSRHNQARDMVRAD